MKAATTSNRSAEAEIDRQINFQQTMKDRALKNYLAKVAQIDDKIDTLQKVRAQVNGADQIDALVSDGIVNKTTPTL